MPDVYVANTDNEWFDFLKAPDFTDRSAEIAGKVGVSVMHLAKGLEFKAVAVMACDADVLPLKSSMDAVIDEDDLDDVFETESQLFYVACTRARIAC